jgi:hypothetical protein
MFSRRFLLAASVIGIFACAAQKTVSLRQVTIAENEVGFKMLSEQVPVYDNLFGCQRGYRTHHTPLDEPLKPGVHNVGGSELVYAVSCGPVDFSQNEYARTFYYDADGAHNLERKPGNWHMVNIDISAKVQPSCENVEELRRIAMDDGHRTFRWPKLDELSKNIERTLEKTVFVECRESNLKADDDACVAKAQKVAEALAANAPDLVPGSFKININDKPWGKLEYKASVATITKK